jgi:hypothetical protein
MIPGRCFRPIKQIKNALRAFLRALYFLRLIAGNKIPPQKKANSTTKPADAGKY